LGGNNFNRMHHKKVLSVVIPAYTEEQNIAFMYDAVLTSLQQIMGTYDYEMIFVNDGSKDSTWEEIEKLCAHDPRVLGLNLSRNFGKEIAITAGLEHASGDAVITLDADGQHPPERIPDFVQKWEEGYDIVYNQRPEIPDASFMKRFTSQCFYALFNAMSEFKLEPGATDYRLLDRAVVNAYLRFREKNRMYRGLIDWLGFNKTALVFDAKKRFNGNASYSYRKLLGLAINNLTSFSFFPLKFVGYIGSVIVSLGACILVLQMMDKIGLVHLGFSNLGIVVVINTIMIGIVLMSLGLIGLYIANIHEEVIGRPLYITKGRKNISQITPSHGR